MSSDLPDQLPRLLRDDVRSAPLDALPLDPYDVLAGEPSAGLLALAEVGGTEVGLWTLSEGTVRDVEADEVFVVLDGDATLTFLDGPAVELGPGTAVHLRAGDRTTWEVRSPLRKVYVTPLT